MNNVSNKYQSNIVDLDEVKRFGAMGRQLGFARAAGMAEDIAAEVTRLRAESEATRDMLQDARAELDQLREALGVSYEPHQSLSERMLEAARLAGRLSSPPTNGRTYHMAVVNEDEALPIGDGLTVAAINALRSYEYGNASPDLAAAVADRLSAARKGETLQGQP